MRVVLCCFRSRFPSAVWIAMLLSAASLLPSSFAQGAPPTKDEPAKDILIFKNGDQLSGQLERSTPGNVVFKSDMAGELTIAWDKIKELRAAGRFAVLEKGVAATRKLDNVHIPEGSVTVADQTVTVQTDKGTPVEVAVKDVDYLVDQKTYEKQVRGQPGLFSNWNGALTAGATLVRATTDSETYNGAISLVRLVPDVTWLLPRTRSTVNFALAYGKIVQRANPEGGIAESVTKTDIYHGDAEHDIYFSPRFYVLADTSFDHNFAQGLTLEQDYGGGIGWTAIKKPKQQLDFKATAEFERQAFYTAAENPNVTEDRATQNLIAGTFAENYLLKLPRTIVVTEQVQAIPAFNQTNDYSGLAQLGVALPIWKRFNFSVVLLDNYLNDPAPGTSKNSFQATTGIQYTLK